MKVAKHLSLISLIIAAALIVTKFNAEAQLLKALAETTANLKQEPTIISQAFRLPIHLILVALSSLTLSIIGFRKNWKFKYLSIVINSLMISIIPTPIATLILII